MIQIKTFFSHPRNVVLFVASIVLLLAATAILGYTIKARSDLAGSQAGSLAQPEVAKIVESVGKLMVLPQDEEPTVASVADVDKLKGQPFFVSAQNGDQVLIYAQNRKAILYRPSSNKIIDVAPVNIGTSAAVTNEPTAIPISVASTVALYNGTTVTGLTRQYETTLGEKFPDMEVRVRENAARQDYEKTILIDLTSSHKDQATQMASALGITSASLPEGETRPANVDFLIILGSDRQ